LAAFRLGWEQGADAIEGDFYLTKDGEIVCLHDKDTKRVAQRNLVVKDSTLAELQALDVGLYRGEKFRGERVPTLAEVFATVPAGKKIYVEVKCGVEIVPALVKAVKASKLKAEQVVVICFNAGVIAEVKRVMPKRKAYWLCGISAEKNGVTKPTMAVILNTLAKTKADGLSSSYAGVTEAIVKEVQRRGLEYHVWTVDAVAVGRKFRELGARSITTNVPALMRKGLGEIKK
jgi:glycerophosphoryl diester phosphodiesterase